jgi:DNA polymerase III alpha subunit
MMFIKMLRSLLAKFDQVEELAVVDLTPRVKDISEPVFSIAKAITENFLRFKRLEGEMPSKNKEDRTSIITLTDTELKFSISWKSTKYSHTRVGASGREMVFLSSYVSIQEDSVSPWLTLDEVEFLEETYTASKKLYLETKNTQLREEAAELYRNTKIWEF